MKLLKRFLPILKAVAPTIATLTGSPLAGTALNALMGLGDNEQEVAKALAEQSPATLQRLREIDAELKTTLAKMEVDLEGIAATDRDSARKRYAEMNDWMPGVLAGAAAATFFTLLFGLMFGWMQVPDNNEFVLLLAGAAISRVESVYQFYFGSSTGSKAKTKVMNGGGV